MQKEQITNKEAISLLALFLMGSTLILGSGGQAKNNAWIAAIIGIVISIPVVLIYSRLLSLFPGRDLFEIVDIVFGKVLGKIINGLYVWYAFHLGAIVLRNVGEFLNIVAIPETPMIFELIYMGVVCHFAAKSGVEVMGRLAAYLLPVILGIIAVVYILGLPLFKLHYIKPIFGGGIAPILKGSLSSFSFPYAESVLFTGILYTLKSKKASYKVYLSGIALAGLIIVMLTFRNIVVLGNLRESLYFPSYVAVSRIRVGDFLQRIEVTVAIVLVASALLKSTVCLFVACKGIAKIFNLTDYRSIVLQTGLLKVYFSYIVYNSVMEMQYWAFEIYAYYAFPFQVILPIIILIFAEIKTRKKAKAN